LSVETGRKEAAGGPTAERTSDAPSGTIDFTIPTELRELVERVREFIEEEVYPAEVEVKDIEDWESIWPTVEMLREKARERGLFVPHMPEEWGGLGVGVLGMALINQECGVSGLASLGMNCMAPDEGNMHTLLHFGSDEQKERYLRPLVEGKVRSCFSMTEKEVAGSDPTLLETRAVRDGAEWVVNGEKWFSSGADGAAFAILMAVTNAEVPAHEGCSLFVLPTDAPGWSLVRDIPVMGTHGPGGHCEIKIEDMRLPADALLGEEGKGFEIAQFRLAGGRLAHAMRWIGVAQRALDLTSRHVIERKAFGKELARHQAVQWWLADSAIELYASRLMVLHAAWKVENGLPYRQEIAMVKVFVAEALGRIVDRAVQAFGSHGIAMDLPIARFYRDARAARIYDGPSEVHRMVIARGLLKLAIEGESTKRACGDLA
jgi:acyl-CoA dehydrogenase